MGYNPAEISVPLRLDNHLGPETERDKQAANDLRMEIEALIKSTPEYERIAILGVEGPGV